MSGESTPPYPAPRDPLRRSGTYRSPCGGRFSSANSCRGASRRRLSREKSPGAREPQPLSSLDKPRGSPAASGRGVFEQELEVRSKSSLELFLPPGREGGREALSSCQQILSVSERLLPTPALLAKQLCMKAMLFHWIEPSDHKPFPVPQTEM